MHAVPQALALAVEKAGGEIRYDTAVERILLRQGTTGRVCGVRLAGRRATVPADAVDRNA